MRVFAIGDLHMSGNGDKPMHVFGSNWDAHVERISDAWSDAVLQDDVVLIPGDISWAMHLEDAMEDIRFIAGLKGKKVMIRGNHDYWWTSLSKTRERLPVDFFALQNDSIAFSGISFAGTRGWTCPNSLGFNEESDRKIYERELIRLELSLKKANPSNPLIGMIHFPPFNERHQPSGFAELFEKYGALHVVYGHLHDKSCRNAFEGKYRGVTYTLCSADHIDFIPKLIAEF